MLRHARRLLRFVFVTLCHATPDIFRHMLITLIFDAIRADAVMLAYAADSGRRFRCHYAIVMDRSAAYLRRYDA